ncbi:hypothetical protein [Herbidospora daliensis]|nr:hypothetical protein [Herbidospora daliensis]
MPRKKPVPCLTCGGEGQIEDTVIVRRGRSIAEFDTWALCLDCSGTGIL